MVERAKAPFFRRFFSSRLFLVAALVAILFIAFANLRVYYHGYKIKQEIRAMQADISSLNQKKIESMEILKYVMSNDFVEEKARTELNMKKPGEHVVIITNEAEVARGEAEGGGGIGEGGSQNASGQGTSNPLKWWYYFTHASPSAF